MIPLALFFAIDLIANENTDNWNNGVG